MRIGFNFLNGDPTYRSGINTFAIGLLRGLSNVVGEDHRIQLYVNENNANFFEELSYRPNVDRVIIPRSNMNGVIRRVISQAALLSGSERIYRAVNDAMWRYCTLAMDEGSDVIYTPMATLGFYNLQKPTILSMHDIQHVHYPQFFSWLQRLSRNVRYPLSARCATYIQASSEFIRKDFLHNFPWLKSDNVIVIPEGVSISEFSSPSTLDVVSKYGIPRNYMFFPAQIWPHKNHITVLKALNYLKKSKGLEIPLVMTGGRYNDSAEVFSYIEANRMDNVFYLGKVPFDDMVALYQQAHFFITAVLYESSSLPFLEAAASGCPILASDTPPNRELAKRLKATLFDPLDDCQLRDIIENVWLDNGLRKSHIDFNVNAVHYYHWDNVAQRYLDFINQRIN